MVFSSVTFLCLFLPLFLVVYFVNKNTTYKNIILVAFSLLFYSWGEPVWVLALLLSGLTDYLCGIVLGRNPAGGKKKIALAASLVINLGMLSAFKYSGFVVDNINALFHIGIPVPRFNLPLGISFYTFQTLSYTIDVYRGKTKVQKSFLSFLCYVSMFPQLVAGPIVRYSDIESDLTDRKISVERLSAGITRFAAGLAKKVLLANPAGAAAAMLLADTSKITTASAWLGIILFAFQIYFDFSGYSDMAIGIGKMIGFDFPENFNYPYEAKTVTDFWRKWHISLSAFFRDYVYIPLGGNRKMQVRNIAIVWLLTGIWHGASWNFILWGAYYGILLLLERYALRRVFERIPAILTRIYTLLAVLIGWGLFYFTDFSELWLFIKALFFVGAPLSSFLPESVFLSRIWLIIVLAAASTSVPKKIFKRVFERYPRIGFAEPVCISICMLASFLMLLGQTYNPFLYFRF
ncbi:MAG: MBOAT family protein [Oscillospiraceae bacterium]|jgi:alginate O-acetyltransferase complex protein AlgI|nr:MBOAT family protein [Oscillospiraceae bacterium]